MSVRGVAWICPFCGEAVVEDILPSDTAESLRVRFEQQANSHIDFETDLLVEEIALGVGNGPQSG